MSTDSALEWLTLYRAFATGSAGCLSALEAAGGDIGLAASRVLGDRKSIAAVTRAASEAQRDCDWLAASGTALITWHDSRYPPLLRRIPNAPFLLFAQGDLDALWTPQLAIVGSRQATAGGVATARDFASAFVERGFCVVSGLAAGIDAAAHTGALDAGGLTVAVLGTGLDRIYPNRNTALAERVRAAGALVSEFPPRTVPRREHFPRRNRIISGLALGTLVVEASLGSGSLITARMATEQGREVFAIPGSIHNPLAKGCHRLIRDGAKLVESAQEIMDELRPLVSEWRSSLSLHESVEQIRHSAQTHSDALDDPDYSSLRQALGYDPVGLDELHARTRLTVPVLSSMLLRMELEGEVVANPGGTYSRNVG